MAKLSKEQLARGVITSSAGNHAQGVALAAGKLVRGAGAAWPCRCCCCRCCRRRCR
jgi:threonine dehydratase